MIRLATDQPPCENWAVAFCRCDLGRGGHHVHAVLGGSRLIFDQHAAERRQLHAIDRRGRGGQIDVPVEATRTRPFELTGVPITPLFVFMSRLSRSSPTRL